MATMPRFTIMREDVSYVLAREYGDPRDSTTILAALLAIGGAKRVLILSDDDDGIWTLTSDVTIPANVTLSLPSGVTLAGTANLIIEGNLLALRTDWWQSTGIVTWSASSTPWETSRAHIGRLNLDIPLAITSGGTGASTVPQAQINLGIVPGTHVQPYDATLAAFAALAGTANTLAYFTNPDQMALTALTPLARTLIGNTTTALMQATLGLGALAPLNAVDTPQIVDRAVTYAKMQNVTNARLLGRADSVAGPTQEITVGPGLTLTGGVLGMQGGAVSGSGVANRATYWTGATAQSYDEGYQYDPTPHLLTVPRFRGSDTTNHAFVLGTDVTEAPGFSHAYLRFADTVTNTPQWLTGLRITEVATRGSISPTAVMGLAVHTNLNQASFNVSGTPSFDLLGIEGWTFATGISGTIGMMGGLSLMLNNAAAGTVTSMFCIHIDSANSGVLNNWYGIVLRNPPVVTVGSAIGYYSEMVAGTNRWNLYLAGTANNFMLGALGVGAAPPADIPGSIYTPNWLRAGGVHSTGALNVGGATNLVGNTASQGWGAFLTGVVAGAASAPQGGRMLDVWGNAYVSANLYVGNDVTVPHLYATGVSSITGPLRVGDQAAAAYTLHVSGTAHVSGAMSVAWPPQANYELTTNRFYAAGVSYCGSTFTATSLASTYLNVTASAAITGPVRIGDQIYPGYGFDVNAQSCFRGLVGIYYAPDAAYWLRCASAKFDGIYAIDYVDMQTLEVRGNAHVAGIAGIGRGGSGGWSLCVGNMYADTNIECNALYVRSITNIAMTAYPGYYLSAYNIYSGTNVYAATDISGGNITVRGTLFVNGATSTTAQGAADGGTYSAAYWWTGNPNWASIRSELVHVHGSAVYLNIAAGGANNYYQFHIAGVNAYIGLGAWVDAPSDRRVKRAITPIDTPLARLAKLHGARYERTDVKAAEGFPAPNPFEYGLIAQDVAEALPDAAFEHDYGEERGTLWNYYNRPILALLVEAVKDLAQQVADLKAAKEAA